MAKAEDPGEHNWRRIKATVKPLTRKGTSPLEGEDREGCQLAGYRTLVRGAAQGDASAVPPPSPRLARQQAAKPSLSSPSRGEAAVAATPLAKDWERTLRSGRAQPDMVIDLHGHNLAGAHTALGRALDRAASQGARILLVIAGKSRGPDEAPRGAIRRELTTWLAHSSHAGRILAVRNAHPRHGGAGAVYLVLRKP